MNSNIRLPENYLSTLLSMSDDVKRHVIRVLSKSMHEKSKKKVNAKQKQIALSAEAFIDSLIVKGGDPVPENVNSISSLIDEKYI